MASKTGIELQGLGRVIRDLHDEPGEVARRVMLAVDRHLVASTPVRTGRARANWNASNESPELTNIEEGEYAAPSPKTLAAWSKSATRIYNTNNLPYIPALNEGHSPLADAGFVEDAIKAGVKEASK